jgi:hypothetical protein
MLPSLKKERKIKQPVISDGHSKVQVQEKGVNIKDNGDES